MDQPESMLLEDLPSGKLTPISDSSRLANEAGISLAGKVLGRGVHVLGQILIARWLGPENFGIYAVGYTILHIAGILGPLGLNQGIIHFSPRYLHSDPAGLKGLFLQVIRTALMAGLILALVLVGLSNWLEGFFDQPQLASALRWFALSLPFFIGLTVLSAATRVTQKIKYAVLAEDLVQTVGELIFLWLFFWLGLGLTGSILASVIAYILAFGVALWAVFKLFPHFHSTPARVSLPTKELLLFSLPTAFTSMFGVLIIWIDRLLISYYRPAAEVGIYQAASQTSIFFALILNAINAIFTPMIASLYFNKEMRRLEELFRVSTKWGLYLSLPVILVIFLAPADLMRAVFGEAYSVGYLPLLILTVGQTINIATGAVGMLLIMTRHQRNWLAIAGLMLALNILLNLTLVPRWGMVGAAIATSAAVCGQFLAGLWLVRSKLKLWPYDQRYLKGIAATAISALAGFLFLTLTGFTSPWVNLLATATVVAITFLLILSAAGFDQEDRDFFGLMLNKVKRGRAASHAG